MAKRTFHFANWTPAPTADTTNLTNAQYMALKGGSATQLIDILEVMGIGLNAASAPMIMQLCRVSTLETGPSALASPASDGPSHPSTAALAAPPVSFTATATNGPQKSAVTGDMKLELGFNGFGGINKWNAAPTQQFSILGNTANLGECVYGQFTGGSSAPISSHIIYEPY